jgi:hypothetical protein
MFGHSSAFVSWNDLSNLNASNILSRVWGSVTNNNGLWIGWLDLLALLLQLQSIITAHNQWLPETRSIPYWTISVCSYTVADLVPIYESVTSSASVVCWVMLRSWTLKHDCNPTDFSCMNDLWWLLAYKWLEWHLSYKCLCSCLHSHLYSLQSPCKMLVACSYLWKPLLLPLTWKTYVYGFSECHSV